MSHKHGLEAYLTLKDVRNNQDLMGGLVVLLAGDLRQTHPIIPQGTPADEINTCINKSFLWSFVEKKHLTQNMRVLLRNDYDAELFSSTLLDIGNGQIPADYQQRIDFPSNFASMVASSEELRGRVFPSITDNYLSDGWLCKRAILAPKNDTVSNINSEMLTAIPGEATEYLSIDTVLEEDEAVQYPGEFLNPLELPGVPPHKLKLKVGVPIMLLRNLEAPRLCNGTRLIVKSAKQNVVEAVVLTGCAKGDTVFIPRIPIIRTDLPFTFKRLQFLLKLAFAMTINKSQTLQLAGFHLQNQCFPHGQLYVARTRESNSENLYIYTPENKDRLVLGQGYIDPETGPFCWRNRRAPLCCQGRNDSCSLPRGYGAMETRCYCDSFCKRTHPRPHQDDCCPDYPQACEGAPEPSKEPPRCYYKGQFHVAKQMFKDNCKVCECVMVTDNRMEVMCTPNPCMIDEDMIERINRRERRSWTAGNVTNFWGRELDRDGYNGMLGTNYSNRRVMTMRAIKSHARLADLPLSFDWRQRGIVHPIEDQRFCNASWSFSIVSTYSDRLSKWSDGAFRGPLSYQQHRTCVRGQTGCRPGYLTRSWKYVMRKGLTTQSCYPSSTNTRCEIREGRLAEKVMVNCATGGMDKLYKASPLSRMSGEAAIMKEIKDAGPVIATMRVFSEFFMYKGGIYDCPSRNPKLGRLHSVKLVGWGEEYNGQKYWIAANSWGTDWGEDGFFKIKRGQNECDIEELILAFYTNSRRFKRNSPLNETLDFSDDMVQDLDAEAIADEEDEEDDEEDEDEE